MIEEVLRVRNVNHRVRGCEGHPLLREEMKRRGLLDGPIALQRRP